MTVGWNFSSRSFIQQLCGRSFRAENFTHPSLSLPDRLLSDRFLLAEDDWSIIWWCHCRWNPVTSAQPSNWGNVVLDKKHLCLFLSYLWFQFQIILVSFLVNLWMFSRELKILIWNISRFFWNNSDLIWLLFLFLLTMTLMYHLSLYCYHST